MARLTPEDADRIFSSHVDERDLELGALAAFVREVRHTHTRAPDPQTQARHLRAMAEEFVATPPPAAVRRPRRVARRAVVAGLVGSLLIGGSALAGAGHLPAPAQNAVANAVERVGLKLPKASRASATGKERSDAAKARSAANKARAKAFTEDKKDWNACVADKKSRHPGPGPFDPEAPEPEGCGPKPRPQDYQPTKTNPAGHENHGKGPSPKPGKPEDAGAKGNQGQGQGQGRGNPHGPSAPASNTGSGGPNEVGNGTARGGADGN